MEKLYGKQFSKSESLRAITFKAKYLNAYTQDNIFKLMRHNNITEFDSLSKNTDSTEDLGYWSVVGVRGDLADQFKKAYGVIDTKIASGKYLYNLVLSTVKGLLLLAS